MPARTHVTISNRGANERWELAFDINREEIRLGAMPSKRQESLCIWEAVQ